MRTFRRSETDLDAVSEFTPESFLGRGEPRTAEARRTLAGLGFLDTLFPSEFGTTTEPAFGTEQAGSGFDWNKMITSIGDIVIAKEQADLARDVQQINIQRAREGLAPIPQSAIAPQVNVGVAPDVQRTILTVGLGAAVILGGAYAFGVIGKGRRRRR